MIKNFALKFLSIARLTLLLGFNHGLLNATELESIGFKHISTEHGLSQKTVQSIYQDSVGFLWIGTQEGLNRYDGREVRVFRHIKNKPQSISHDVIRDIVEDSQGVLWIASSGGLDKYHAESESFERINLQTSQKENIERLNTLFVDSTGVLWIGTNGYGVFKRDTTGGSEKFEAFNQVEKLTNADVRAIYEDSRGRIWIGTDGLGVFLISANETTQYLYDENNQASISHDRIRSILEDHKGRIWLGTRGGGLNRYDELSKKFTRYFSFNSNEHSLSHDRVYRIYQDKNRTLWIATDDGLSVYQPDSDDFIRIKHKPSQQSGLNHNRVLSIFQDKGGMLWIGTLAGLNQWNPLTAAFVHYRHISEDELSLSDNTVYAFAENNDGKIFVGTFGGGLNVLDEKSPNSVKLLLDKHGKTLTDQRITSMLVDQENNLWVGSISQGVDVFSKSLNKTRHFETIEGNLTSLSANGVTDILQDSDGEIWISTYQAGLNRLNKTDDSFSQYRLNGPASKGLTNENVFQVMEDDEGYLWLATDGGGIFRLDKHTNEFTQFAVEASNANSLSGNTAWSIYQDSKGRFWIGTQGNGLNRWEPDDRRKGVNRFQHYTVENGLNSSTVNGVLEDKDGYLWISTNRGVSKLNPENDKIEHFNLSDELHFNELNQGAMLKSQSGRLLFGGLNGISAFYPDEVKPNPYMAPLVLTNVMSENRSIFFEQALDSIDEITFDYRDYLIAFEFSILDYAQPQKNNYQYQLVGLDNSWIDNAHLNRATFTNLPAGNYLLKVRGSNNDGLWSDKEINLRVNVLPAPWVSWWAFTLYGFGFVILLVLMIRLQAKRLANQEMFRQQVSEKVAQETALYQKNNSYLQDQIEVLKQKSKVDLATGLPNQKYLYDVASLIVNLSHSLASVQPCPSISFSIALIRIPTLRVQNYESNRLIDQKIRNFSEEFSKQQESYNLLTRWSENDLGIVNFGSTTSENNECLKQQLLVLNNNILRNIGELTENKSIKTCYIVLPLQGVNQSYLDQEKLMMLVEHILHIIECDPNCNTVGIVALNQNLNNVNFKQILASTKISELEEIFEIAIESQGASM